jgi:hypothetical protein
MDGRGVENGKLHRMKEVVVPYFNVTAQNMLGSNEQNEDKH